MRIKSKKPPRFFQMAGHPRFAQRLRKLRGNATQKEYAKFLGISLRAYQSYESGKLPKPATINKIAQKAGVGVDWLGWGSLKSLAEKVVATSIESTLIHEGLTDAEMRLMRYFFERGIVSSEDIDSFMNMTLGMKHRKFQEMIDSLVGDKTSPLYVMKTQLQRIYNEGDLTKLKALKSLLKVLDPAEKKPRVDTHLGTEVKDK